ncbi:hypothetical protein SLS57_002754 [Botryosphaeria dothidea]
MPLGLSQGDNKHNNKQHHHSPTKKHSSSQVHAQPPRANKKNRTLASRAKPAGSKSTTREY